MCIIAQAAWRSSTRPHLTSVSSFREDLESLLRVLTFADDHRPAPLGAPPARAVRGFTSFSPTLRLTGDVFLQRR